MNTFARTTIAAVIPMTIACSGQSQSDPCDGCDLMFQGMPSSLSWSTQIAAPDEPGEPLTIRGTIFKPDGKTPATGIILYAYHTDKGGRYTPSKGQVEGKRHGHLRGWMKTDEKGRYSFTTVRPGAYPNTNNPQHIHLILQEPSSRYYWIDELQFVDDPLLTKAEQDRQANRGGSGILTLKKDGQGVWYGTRDIVLGKNIPGYR